MWTMQRAIAGPQKKQKMEKSGFYKNVYKNVYKQKHHFINKEKKADTKILVKITVNIRVKMVYYSPKKTQLSTKMKLKLMKC